MTNHNISRVPAPIYEEERHHYGLRQVLIWICDACLDGLGGECHTPGCTLWLNRAPDLSLRNNPMVEIFESPGGAPFDGDTRYGGGDV